MVGVSDVLIQRPGWTDGFRRSVFQPRCRSQSGPVIYNSFFEFVGLRWFRFDSEIKSHMPQMSPWLRNKRRQKY